MMRLTMAVVAFLTLAGGLARAQTREQALVDRSTLAVQEIMGSSDGSDPQSLLRRARGVMICPRIFRAGFILGGSGGYCVMSVRDGQGGWSYPAFYDIGSGSVGLQIGVQDAEVMILILTDRGLNAVLDSQFKFGGDASVSVGTLGNALQGATTAAGGPDIVVTAKTRGLFAGLSLEGSIMASQTGFNRAYYGQNLAARQIVIDHAVGNPGADPLREMLARYGAPRPAIVGQAAPPPAGYRPAPAYGQAPPPPPQPYNPSERAPVTQQSLPPPR